MLESPGDGRVKSGRLGTRQDAGIIHNDDYHFPPPNDDKITTTMESETEDEYTDIPDTPWTACMPIDTNSFKFVKQFEWPSSFSISPPQRQKPRWDKNLVPKNQRAKAYTIDEMIQMARQTTKTALPPEDDLEADTNDGDTTKDTSAESGIPSNFASSACVNKSNESSTSGSRSRGVGLITPLESDESVGESIGSATENSNGLNSIIISVVSTNQSNNNSRSSSQSAVLSLRSESHSDWDNKWNFTPTSISPTAKTPRSSNKPHVHCKWENRCGSPVKVSCDIINREATTTTITTHTTDTRTSPRNRIRRLNESTTRSYNETTPSIESIVTPCGRLQALQEKKSPAYNGNSDTTSTTTAESSTTPITTPRRITRRRIKSDTTATAWSATIDRSPRVVRPRYRSATGGSSTTRCDISKSSAPRTEPIRSWSIFDQSGHFCTCTSCATVVLQTPLQEEEFYTHQQRRCCRGPFEKEIAELIADIKEFDYEDDGEQDEHDDNTTFTAKRKNRSYRGDALLVLANPLRELSLLCRDVRNIHAIRLFGGVQAVVGAMNGLRQHAHEHLQRRQAQKQECEETVTSTNNMPPPPNTSQSVDDDQCYSTALRYGCSVLQYVAREHAQSNSSSSSTGTFAHRISLVMLLSGGGNSNSGVQGIVQAMKLFPLDHALQRTGTRALMNMSNSSRDACQAILDASFSNENIDSRGDIAPATGITVNGGQECVYSGIVEELVSVLENFPHCPSIKESALVTLCNLFEKVPDAAMKQLAPRRGTTPPAEHVQVTNNASPGERRSRPSKESKVVTVADEGLSTSPHSPTEISAEPCLQSIREISSVATCTTARTRTRLPTTTRIPKECTLTTPLPPSPVVVSSPRAVVKVEDITLMLDSVLRLGPKRHYHYENKNANNSDDDSDDDASALWNRVYRLEQRLLIGEVLENVFHGHPRLCFEEKKCDV